MKERKKETTPTKKRIKSEDFIAKGVVPETKKGRDNKELGTKMMKN